MPHDLDQESSSHASATRNLTVRGHPQLRARSLDGRTIMDPCLGFGVEMRHILDHEATVSEETKTILVSTTYSYRLKYVHAFSKQFASVGENGENT